MPEVSIVMAVFNGSRTICKAIDSIVGQTYTDWELVIVNDASTDNTLEIVNSYIGKHDNICCITNDSNLGLARSLNRGIAVAQGRYVARMDDDDVCRPTRLQEQVEFLRNNPKVDVLGTAALLLREDGTRIGEYRMPETHEEVWRALPKKNPFLHPSVMMKKTFLDATGGYDESLRRKEDYDLWARGSKNHVYHNLQTPLLDYRVKDSKPLKAAFYSFMVRLRNGVRGGYIISGAFWAFVVLGVNLIRNLGYRQPSHR